ncbi:MAG: hypothetical protein IJS08_10475, partial [Victivallales bacterium]|nr:hypothetical protein [Victivallales bacterium]
MSRECAAVLFSDSFRRAGQVASTSPLASIFTLESHWWLSSMKTVALKSENTHSASLEGRQTLT